MLTSKRHKFSSFKNIFYAGYWKMLVILLATPFLVADAKQSCDVPSVHEQSSTTLTCTFDENIAVVKKSIIVLHYGESSSDQPDTVLYNGLFQGEARYFTHPGYTLLGSITNTLALRIDRASRNHIGLYECHIMPSMPGDAEPCKFSLTDIVIPTPNTSKPTERTVLPHLPGIPEDRVENLFVTPLLITVCTGMFLILVGLLVAVVIYCKRTRLKPDDSKDSTTKKEQALLA